MRIAVAWPACQRRRWPKAMWMLKGFASLGHRLSSISNIKELEAADKGNDLIVFSQHDAGLCWADVAKASKEKQAPWIQWWFDLMALDPNVELADQPHIRSLGGMMRSMDRVFVKERGLLDDYRKLGIAARWLDQGCLSTIRQVPLKADPKWDLAFFGSVRPGTVRNYDIIEIARSGLRVIWAAHPYGDHPGNGIERLDWVHPEEWGPLISDSVACLDIGYRHDLDGYWSDRVWLLARHGAPIVRRASEGFPPGPHLDYSDPSEVAEIVGRLRGDILRRTSLGAAAREWSGHHTYERRCEEILEVCRTEGLL